MVHIDFLKQKGRVFLTGMQNSHNLVHLPRKNVPTVPEVDVENFIFDNCPLDPPFLL